MPYMESNNFLLFLRENMLLATVIDSFCINNTIELGKVSLGLQEDGEKENANESLNVQNQSVKDKRKGMPHVSDVQNERVSCIGCSGSFKNMKSWKKHQKRCLGESDNAKDVEELYSFETER